jgi:imidazolonepropionase-like amidohydrolase
VIHGVHLDEETIDLMREREVSLEPTLSVYESILEAGSGVPTFMIKRTRAINAAHRASFRAALEAGVRVAAGTDSGLDYHQLPDSLLRELQCFVREGMSRLGALMTATKHAAEIMGLDSTLGTLSAGALADILAVDNSPLDDISNLKQVRLVMHSGRIRVNHVRDAQA